MKIWPFNREAKEQDNVPQEIQEYYQAERRERVGVAWMLALATLVVTVLLAIGLFFGGRWVYRAVFDNDGGNDTDTTEQGAQEEGAPEGTRQPQNGVDTPEANQGGEAPASDEPARLPGDNTAEPQEEANGGAATTSTPRTGPLPDTGPGDVVSVFVGTVIVATLIHHAITGREQETRN